MDSQTAAPDERPRATGSGNTPDASQQSVASVRETPGEWLFHYTKLRTAVEHILPTRQLRLSPFSEMRDPREYTDWIPSGAGFIGEATTEELDAAFARDVAHLNSLKGYFRLLAFTEDDLSTEDEYGRGYARSRLWESYADVHRGVCLAFHKETAISEIGNQLQTLGAVRHEPVTYENRPISNEIQIDLRAAVEGRSEEENQRRIQEHIKELFFTKNTEWASENEYRFLVGLAPGAGDIYVDVRESLVALCMGPELSKHYFPALRDLCREHDGKSRVAVAKLLWHNNRPLLAGITVD